MSRWGMRLAAAATVALTGGFAAAAYASALPAPVQHIAYRLLGPIGVPDSHHGHANSGPPSHRPSGLPAGRHHRSASGTPSPLPSASASARPGASSPAAAASAQPSATAPAGPDRLSASASSSEITAGTAVVISGQLTNPAGGGVAGTVRLLERPGRRPGWRLAGSDQASPAGNVAVTIPALGVNAAFELLGPGGVLSLPVTVTVIPPVDTQLVQGIKRDALIVSTQYARRGNVVVLEKQAADGSWVYLRAQRLNAAGKARFVLKIANLQGQSVRVVLLATPRHGESASQPVTVPPPAA